MHVLHDKSHRNDLSVGAIQLRLKPLISFILWLHSKIQEREDVRLFGARPICSHYSIYVPLRKK